MSVPYVFATLPNGTAIPLSYLDADFTYLTTSPVFSGNVTIEGTLSVLEYVNIGAVSLPDTGYNLLTIGGSSKASELFLLYENDSPGIQTFVYQNGVVADNTQYLLFRDSDGNNNIYFGYDGDNSGYGAYIGVVKSQPLTFYTTDIERMRITAEGDVGIGTTSPVHDGARTTLTVGGDSSNGQIVWNYDDGSLCSAVYASNGSLPGQDYVEWDTYNSSGDEIGYWYFYEQYSTFGSSNSPLYLESSGTNVGVGVSAYTTIYLAPSTTGYMGFLTNSGERARITANGELLIGTTVSGASKLVVNDNSIQINTAKTPATASSTGTTGQICWDSSYIYVCVATNTWKKASIATW